MLGVWVCEALRMRLVCDQFFKDIQAGIYSRIITSTTGSQRYGELVKASTVPVLSLKINS
jgi:hypothetical protein